MTSQPVQPRLASIRLHPIKALDPISVNEAHVGPSGGLEFDRAWALYTVDNRWVNGKRTPAIFLIRAEFAPDVSSVKLSVPGDRRNIPAREFAFPQDVGDPLPPFVPNSRRESSSQPKALTTRISL